MNTRHCVHFASQGSVGSDSLALLRLMNNELTRTNIYHQLAIYLAVICWFALGHQPSDCYTRKGRAAQWSARNGFGERAAVGVYYEQLRVNVMLLSVEDGKPQIVEVDVKSKRRLDVRLEVFDRHRVVFFNLVNT